MSISDLEYSTVAAGPAEGAGGEEEGGGPHHSLLQQEEGCGGLHPHHGERPGGTLGGRGEDPLPVRQAEPRPGLRPGDERDHRADILRPRLGLGHRLER